jgi:hypothetical protein
MAQKEAPIRKPILLTVAAIPTALGILVAMRFAPAIPPATTQPPVVAATPDVTPIAPAAVTAAKAEAADGSSSVAPQVASIQPQGRVKAAKAVKRGIARAKARKAARLHASAPRPAVRAHNTDGSSQ